MYLEMDPVKRFIFVFFVVSLFTLRELRGENVPCQLGVMVADEEQEIAETWHRIHNKNKLRGIEISKTGTGFL